MLKARINDRRLAGGLFVVLAAIAANGCRPSADPPPIPSEPLQPRPDEPIEPIDPAPVAADDPAAGAPPIASPPEEVETADTGTGTGAATGTTIVTATATQTDSKSMVPDEPLTTPKPLVP